MDLFSQPDIKGKFKIHSLEKGKENSHILKKNKTRFESDARILFDAFMRGEKHTVKTLALQYDIWEWRRRCKDIADLGFRMKEKLQDDKFKIKWMDGEDIIFNKDHFKTIFEKEYKSLT